MDDRICPVCNEAIPAAAHGNRKYCSTGCRRWAEREIGTATCSLADCNRAVRARGLCSTHYNERQETRHRKVQVPCAACGALVEKYSKKRTPVCSYRCRYYVQRGHWPKSKELVGPIEVPPVVRSPEPPLNLTEGPRRFFVSGPCEWCGDRFVKWTTSLRSLPVTCSERCSRNRAKARRGKHFKISPVIRAEIYERDDWTCQLCLEPVDREADPLGDWAPTLDHIVPRSQGGSDDDDNLRTAHRWCNAVRGNETYYTAEDLRLGA